MELYQPFIANFTQWYSQLKTQVVQTQPTLANIPAGYRAIVRWVRSRMTQELHSRISVQLNNTLTTQQPVL